MVEIPIFPQPPPPPLLRGLKPKIYSKYCSYKKSKIQKIETKQQYIHVLAIFLMKKRINLPVAFPCNTIKK